MLDGENIRLSSFEQDSRKIEITLKRIILFITQKIY
jgi:hypothetical protein